MTTDEIVAAVKNDLDILSNHADDTVRKIASELRINIVELVRLLSNAPSSDATVSKKIARPVAAASMYYFGAIDRSGHYLCSSPPPNGLLEHIALGRFVETNPWGRHIDTGLCPATSNSADQIEGRALVHHKYGWTALSFWDRSVDSHYGSCSTFLAEGICDFENMITLANIFYPKIMKRYTFSIVDAAVELTKNVML